MIQPEESHMSPRAYDAGFPIHTTPPDYSGDDSYAGVYDYNDTECTTGGNNGPGADVVPSLLSIVFILGLTGNLIILWILVCHAKLKKISDLCLFNLAISDLVVALSLPVWVYYLMGHGFESQVLCKMIHFIYQVGFYSGILFVTLMGVDRYLAIVHAVTTMRVRSLRYGAGVSFVIWVLSILCATPEAVFMGIFKDGNETSCQPLYPSGSEKSWKLFRNFRENILGLFIALPVMMYCYVSILRVLLRSRNSKRYKAMRLILATAFIFALFWVPYNVVVFLQSLLNLSVINSCQALIGIEQALSLTETLLLAHCCVNPFIYAFVGEKFRKVLKHVLTRIPLCAYFCKQHIIPRVSENETSNTPVNTGSNF